ncbi:MAG: phosphoglycerate kinase, partial [Planctomycetales bacterium]|nr:phosphoglycerate kinase [Planctomycetales bacterium]NIP04410.1 phosphoglycerate kinase [Planctomycetales bacterium]
NLSLEQLIPTLERAFECTVEFSADCVGREAELAAENLQPGRVLLLENTR